MPGKKKADVDGLDDPSFMIPSAPYAHPDATPAQPETKKGVSPLS